MTSDVPSRLVRHVLLATLAVLMGVILGRYGFPRNEPIVAPKPEAASDQETKVEPAPSVTTSEPTIDRGSATQMADKISPPVVEDDKQLDAEIERSDEEEQAALQWTRQEQLLFYNAHLASAGNADANSSGIARELSRANHELEGSEIGDVRCVESLCRIEVQSENREAQRRLANMLTRVAAFAGGQTMVIPDFQADGRIHMTIFASRSGHELPEPDD